jgi:uncharacterized C2H2 Zn-finger protein
MATHTKARISGYRDGVLSIDLYVLDCAGCGVIFAVTRDYEERRREDAKGFYCPNGHVCSWQESKADKLAKQLADEQRRRARIEKDRSFYQETLRKERERHEHTGRRLAATQGVVTRTKRRIANGVCPCCNRTFADLARHMNSKHPGYVEPAEPS